MSSVILVLLVVGFIAGLIARAVVPGSEWMGVRFTLGLGVIGLVLGWVTRLHCVSQRSVCWFTAAEWNSHIRDRSGGCIVGI